MLSIFDTTGFADEFASFLGARLVTAEPVPSKPGRAAYFRQAESWTETDHLFLDPDTGIALPDHNKIGRMHLKADELVGIATKRPGRLTLVFDQSYSRASDSTRLSRTKEKLRWLQEHGVLGFAYYSHANFVLVSTDKAMLCNAQRILTGTSRLPPRRFVWEQIT